MFVDCFSSFVNFLISFWPIYIIGFLSTCMNPSCSHAYAYTKRVNKKSYHLLASVRCVILITLLICSVDADNDGIQTCENTKVIEMRLLQQLSGCSFLGLELIYHNYKIRMQRYKHKYTYWAEENLSRRKFKAKNC